MILLVIKALHLSVAITWIGGFLAVAIALRALPGMALTSLLRWDRQVTTPAMGLVWALGLLLALRGGWFPAPWLLAKLSLVAGLSMAHGMMTGRLRRLLASTDAPSSGFLPVLAPAIVAAVVTIALLAVLKPFSAP